MSLFDTHIMVDWSGGNDTGAKPRKDAIWICEAGQEPVYLRNRVLVEDWLNTRISAAVDAGERLCIGFDFAFGYPDGFCETVTGHKDPLALWAWLEERMKDAPEANSRFDIGAEINQLFDGIGPFWGNGLKRDIEGLPRKGNDRTGRAMPERRHVETLARGAFAVWQLSGAGAVGGQVLTGLPVLSRLRRQFAEHVSVWPFEKLDSSIAFVEIWPSLISAEIAEQATDPIKDAGQVRVIANVVARLDQADKLQTVLDSVPEESRREGWILGVGAEDIFRAAATARPDRLPSNCFALPPGVDWTPVDEALNLLHAAMRPVVAQEECPIADCGGRVLAEDICAVRSHPPAPNSAVDGYGFHLDEVSGKTVILPLMKGRSAAGVPFDSAVPNGQAVQVLTGAILPDGVNTVALQEDTVVSGNHITIQGPIKPGANTRDAGEDVRAGEVVLPKGRRMNGCDVGLLSAVGCDFAKVFGRLRIRVISTGDELRSPGEVAADHQVYDANGPMLARMAKNWGYEVSTVRVGDDRTAMRQAFTEAANETDAILTSGGASSGAEDHVSALLAEEGHISSWRVALKPGRPLALGQWQGVPIFGLPGNPVAAFVCAALFARPALSVMAGGAWLEPQGFWVPSGFAKRKKDGRREYLRARIAEDGRAEVFASEGSGRISGLSWATGLVELPHEGITVEPGDLVRFIPFASFDQ